MPVILITDALIFFLLAIVGVFTFYARRFEHLRAPWRTVAKNKMAMASAIVLLAYLSIGLMDSLHFHPRLDNPEGTETRYSTEILSLLDLAFGHLHRQNEKTYSAPLASYAFSKETMELPDGTISQVFPRLKYGGAHLAVPEQQMLTDFLIKMLTGVAIGLVLWGLTVAIIIFYLQCVSRISFKQVLSNTGGEHSGVPWRVILITMAIVMILCSSAFYLSHYYHILGTDKIGQDVFYQSLKSIRTGLAIGTLTTLIMLPFALIMGLMAGYFRSWVDDIIQYLYTTLNSIPGVLLIAASILLLQVYMDNHADEFTSLEQRADLRLLFLCMILGITSWTGLCRLLRAETMKLREIDYVQAAQAFGLSHYTIMRRHLLPNVMHIVMIAIVLDFSGLVLAEAVLSYINIGVDPSTNSWGNMINSARLEMAREPVVWWSLAAAFTFMFTLVLAANLFSDAVRDAFDPRLRGSTN